MALKLCVLNFLIWLGRMSHRRYQRALTQRIYVVDRNGHSSYRIMGTTDTVYDVCLGGAPTCSCPDFANGYRCKHIFYILIKDFGLSEQDACLTDIARLIGRAASAMKAEVKQKNVQGMCPICLDELQDSNVVYCKNQCGRNVHADCMERLVSFCIAHERRITCPLCRVNWTT